jgi:hypothetical protein
VPEPASRRRLLRLHAGLLAAVVLCSSAFVIEVKRALDGNSLSWAYVFEWPLLMGYAVYMWHRLVRDEREGAQAASPAPPAAPAVSAADAQADEEREAWNRYLAALHATDATRARRTPGGDG